MRILNLICLGLTLLMVRPAAAQKPFPAPLQRGFSEVTITTRHAAAGNGLYLEDARGIASRSSIANS